MRLVTKGQEETKLTDKRSLLHSVKSDAEMLTKHFLKEAESSINTVLERPPIFAINPKEDNLRFMCIDVDTYADSESAILGSKAR